MEGGEGGLLARLEISKKCVYKCSPINLLPYNGERIS